MSERLTVRNFAGMQEVELDIKKINILIGPQASGKSVLAKLLFFFRGIWREIYFPADREEDFEGRKEKVAEKFKRYFPTQTWGNAMFSFTYEIEGYKIALRRGPSPSRTSPSPGLILQLPEFVPKLFAESAPSESVQKAIIKSRDDAILMQYRAWEKSQKDLRKRLGNGFFTDQLFIPAGRAFFANVETNVFSFIARSEGKLDPFLSEFGEYYTFFRQRWVSGDWELGESPFRDLVLRGQLASEGNNEFVVSDHDRRIPLSNLSSGQQELLPLLFVLEASQSKYLRTPEPKNAAIYVEEPEAHLFPEFQRLTVERIIESCSTDNAYQSIFLTTHSPYVLSALNNLLLAGQLSANPRLRERIAAVVPKSLWINSSDLGAYAINEGTHTNIIDSESELINAEYIDQASTAIGETFDKLLTISAEK